ncbi:MAG: hypothetical protein WCP12_12055 [bacterium]
MNVVFILIVSMALQAMVMAGERSPSANADCEKEWKQQFTALQADIGNKARLAGRINETLRPDSLISEADRDPADIVLRRTAALLQDLKRTAVGKSLTSLEKTLEGLQAAGKTIAVTNLEARYVLYADSCRVRRQIAFKNPLLGFDKLLFAKHHRALYPHMCDQYYGMAARPGGGLYVLSDPFGDNPQLRDVLADSIVQNGRLKGQKLSGGPNKPYTISFDGAGNLGGEETQGGSFLSPDLSFDGKSILFAYVECTGNRKHDHHTDPSRGHWAEGRCYHVFRVNVDGSKLEQLTDGTWNEFDPCLLPSGRIAFISERRGGYLRCGRVCPTYTLYDMAADGSDIRCLSFHETNEWHPTVANDGKIAWTRWDYIDRHFSAAHMPWTTTPGGCDPRPIQGNYAWKGKRPDMEMSLKAIPNSPKYVATATPHHGQAYGSLIIIDPLIADDDAGAPLKRLTPEIGYVEKEADGTETYGTAWPLSEDYHLCVYDANTRPDGGSSKKGYTTANYGIYLVDAFGNKELIYRDPEISCLRPIPLVPRKKPPVVASGNHTAADKSSAEATVSLINVYDSLKPWPDGTKIKALRIWQIIPQSVPAVRAMGIQVPGTGSINIGRYVLGTVPVEADGSAHFIVPAKLQVFFQALDENGLAVQSMRSGTHFQPGEEMACQGCHEPKNRAPGTVKSTPLAMKRPPSRLQPDVDGTNPFSYPRLVQPVLNTYCVECHKKNVEKKAPRLDAEVVGMDKGAYMSLATKYYASYISLTPNFGFYDYGRKGEETHRTMPGKFGALGSKLYPMLVKGHHDVKLTPEAMHRITVWLDSCSMFYGVYEKEGGEAQLRGEIVKPTLE